MRPKGLIYRLRWRLGLEKNGENISPDSDKTQSTPTQSKPNYRIIVSLNYLCLLNLYS